MPSTLRTTCSAGEPAGIATLLAASPDRQILVLRNSRRAFPLVKALARHCFSLRFRQVKEMLEAGRLAAEASVALTIAQTGRSAAELAELRAYASAVYGNALRIAGDFPASGRALADAAGHLDSCPGPHPELAALLLELTASLKGKQGECREAHHLLGRAAAIRRELGDREGLGKIRVQQGIVFGYSGDTERAVATLAGAVGLLGQDRDLARSALQSLIWHLSATSRHERARIILRRVRPLLAEGGELFQLKVQWLEARLAAASPFSSQIATACRCYEATRRAYASRGMPREAALVERDLALARARVAMSLRR